MNHGKPFLRWQPISLEMSGVDLYKHLTFLASYDEDGLTEYLQTIVRILEAELEFRVREDAKFGWRISQHGEPKHADIWVPAKAGHIQKLVNEEIIEKSYRSNRYTHYRLSVSVEELADDVRNASGYLDHEHRSILEELAV